MTSPTHTAELARAGQLLTAALLSVAKIVGDLGMDAATRIALAADAERLTREAAQVLGLVESIEERDADAVCGDVVAVTRLRPAHLEDEAAEIARLDDDGGKQWTADVWTK